LFSSFLKWKSYTLADVRKATSDPAATTANLKTWTESETIQSTPVTGTYYPMFAQSAGSVGIHGNQSGFELYYDDTFDQSRQEDMESIVYSIGYRRRPVGQDTTLALYNIYNEKYDSFTAKPNTVDTLTTKRFYFDEIANNNWTDPTTGEGSVPFPTVIYSDNFKTIGNLILAVEPTLDQTMPYLVNLLTAENFDGTAYANTSILSADVPFYEGTYHYMSGGADGTLDNTTLESLTVAYLSGSVYPDIIDQARYPITHLIDSGYALSAKNALIDFIGLRDDLSVIVATAVSSTTAFTASEDESMGATLRTRVLLHPESTLYGTGACRGMITTQSALLPSGNWTKRVPFSYYVMLTIADAHNATYVKYSPKGDPYSIVSCFKSKSWNWTPASDTLKNLLWTSGLNYAQYYDQTQIFMADMRTVYTYDSSLLSSYIFVCYLTYAKHLMRGIWAKYAGVELPDSELISTLTKDTNQQLYDTFGTYVTMTATFYKSQRDEENGDSITCDLEMIGDMPLRTITCNGIVIRNTTSSSSNA
jgi:hypothetical protein